MQGGAPSFFGGGVVGFWGGVVWRWGGRGEIWRAGLRVYMQPARPRALRRGDPASRARVELRARTTRRGARSAFIPRHDATMERIGSTPMVLVATNDNGTDENTDGAARLPSQAERYETKGVVEVRSRSR